MRIQWNGHACFSIEGREGEVLTDPYGEDVPYEFPASEPDIVTVSHGHFDHNATHRVEGSPIVIDGVGTFDIRGIPFVGIPSFHDDAQGAERGGNRIYAFTVDEIRVAHLGDLGAPLNRPQTEALADVEVLLIPVGGHFTIDAKQARDVAGHLARVRIVIPMHFKTDRIEDWPIETVEPFAALMDNVQHIRSSRVEFHREDLPETQEVWILDYAYRI